jgi:nucleotide-binding universal stress UspA family protein
MQAFEIASQRVSAEVHVLSVVPSFNVDAQYQIPAYAGQSQDLSGAFERLGKHVEARLADFGRKLEGRPGKAPGRVASHVSIDVPSAAIAQLAVDLSADLVLVGTHGRHGVSRLLMGSVAEAVVRWAPCPVLVMRPKTESPAAPVIEPPCPRCVAERKATAGAQFWCEQHRERHGRRHTYHQDDRAGRETNFPLVTR